MNAGRQGRSAPIHATVAQRAGATLGQVQAGAMPRELQSPAGHAEARAQLRATRWFDGQAVNVTAVVALEMHMMRVLRAIRERKAGDAFRAHLALRQAGDDQAHRCLSLAPGRSIPCAF